VFGVFFLPKSDRPVKFGKVDSLSKSDSYPLPRIEDCIDGVGNPKYVSKFDLLKGYWQVLLTEKVK